MIVTIRRLYSFDSNLDEDAVQSIELNHIKSNLDDEMGREDVPIGTPRIFGIKNVQIEPTAGGRSWYGIFRENSEDENYRLDKFEEMMEQILTRVNKGYGKTERKPSCNY